MAGIYIHVPFCSKKCSYCDFYSVVSKSYMTQYIQSLLLEIKGRAREYNGLLDSQDKIETIYIGGGTPSLLSNTDIATIIETLRKYFKVLPETEITIEVNPESVSKKNLSEYRNIGINRISMGVQSFNDQLLKSISRSHTSIEAIHAIDTIKGSGIENLSIDLIYGLPGQTSEMWKKDLDMLFSLDIPHLSAYHLIYEEGTPMWYFRKRGKFQETPEETSIEMAKYLYTSTESHGLIPYEISAFAKKGFESRHNSAYWFGKPYLAFGPSAHGYIHPLRWSISPSIVKYIQNPLSENIRHTEIISHEESMEEYILTRMRTLRHGISLDYIYKEYGKNSHDRVKHVIDKNISCGLIRELLNNHYALTYDGILLMDAIILEMVSE